jgi:hypothetical protein
MIMKWIVVICVILLSGCASIGPRQIKLDRNRYNDVIQDTTNQQLLGDIVRVAYFEPISFLKVANVTSSYTLSPFNQNQANGAAAYTRITGDTNTITRAFTFTPSFSYSDTPTITYAPIDGAEFTNNLMTPVHLETFHFLVYGGMNDPGLIWRIIVEGVGNIDNASSASGAKVVAIPNFHEYYHFLDVFVPLLRTRQCITVPTTVSHEFALQVHCFHAGDEEHLKELLHVPSNHGDLIFAEYSAKAPKSNVVYIQMRSILGIIAYLAHGIELPLDDIKDGEVYQLRWPDGHLFDWTPLMAGMWKVYNRRGEPARAYAKVVVHNHWFYIKDTDLDSKATFMFVHRLITLTAGQQTTSPGPLLTLPAR